MFINKGPPIEIGSQVSLKKAFLKKIHSEQWNAGFGEKEQDTFKLTFTILLNYAILDFGVKKNSLSFLDLDWKTPAV